MSRDDADRWRRIEAICNAALDLDGVARNAYLDEACHNDASLRGEVEALLAREASAQRFLDAPVGAVAADVMGNAERDLIGRRLGDYEVTARLGEGGMGEVYRARDRQLARDVAIKVLPAAFAGDPERLKRFEREARLLATVNHPGIGAIYGLIEADGIRALVLELVDGQTLAAALDRGPLLLSRALSIAAQISDALDHAHRRGITHRDLKPSNVMLTASGVKLLDFGVGKWTSAPGGDAVTRHSTLTGEGAIVGTLHYMAPEQLEGKATDARSDIFAFGAVLYEMLTGRKAFDGPSQASIIAAVMEAPPPRLSGIGGAQALRLERIVNKCLAKSPDERWHSARDLGDELRWLSDDLGRNAEAIAPVAARSSRWRSLPGVAAAAAVVIAIGMLAWSAINGGTPATDTMMTSPVIRFSIPPPAGRRFDHSDIAPDGQSIVFSTMSTDAASSSGAPPVYVQRLDRMEAAALPVIAGVWRLAFSPDGRLVASVGPGGVSTTSIDGGEPVPAVTESLRAPHSLAWAGPEAFFIGRRGESIHRVSATGGPLSAVTVVNHPTEIDHHSPLLLPGGRTLLFGAHDARNRFSIVAHLLATGERSTIVDSGFSPRYSPTGHLVFGRGNRILAARFDVLQARLTGPPVTMVEHAGADARSGEAFFSLSQQGTLVYEQEPRRDGRTMVWVDRAGHEMPIPVSPREFSMPRVSPDGRRLAFVASDNQRRDVWMYDSGTDRLSRVTVEYDNWAPVWVSTGTSLIYASNRGAVSTVMRQGLDGSGDHTLGQSINDLWPTTVSADGRTVILTQVPPTDDYSIAQLTPEGLQPSPFLDGPGLPRAARLSPDGRWLAYVDNRSGRPEIYIRPYPTGAARQVTVDGGHSPVWRHDGRELYFRWGTRMLALPIEPSGTLSWGKPVLLFDRPYLERQFDYDVAPDGRFVMIKFDPRELLPPALNVVLNWSRELLERVPARP